MSRQTSPSAARATPGPSMPPVPMPTTLNAYDGEWFEEDGKARDGGEVSSAEEIVWFAKTQDRARAAEIARRWNAHPALRDALEAMVAAYGTASGEPGSALEQARHALAQAKENA